MAAQPVFKLDLSERFPHLPRAPIVEAVIHWRARSEQRLAREDLRRELTSALPDYPTIKTQHELHFESALGRDGAAVSSRDEWHGFRLESTDGRYIAQFTRGGFVFSRVTPYENWDRFAAEAKRLWQIHVSLAKPSEIERLGVRFINRIVPVELSTLDDILVLPPQTPPGLPLPIDEFLQRSLFDVPGHPYCVNVIQTTQPPLPPETDTLGLILDIDVFTTASIPLNDALADTRLAEMRWLKNKVFFSLISPQATARFQEDSA